MTGEAECRFKDTRHDHWDLDMVGNPIIINSLGSNVAYGLSKTGNTFVVDIKNCNLVNKDFVKK